MRQLDDNSYAVTFSGEAWKITTSALVLAHGKRYDSLYLTSTSSDVQGNTRVQKGRLDRAKHVRKLKGVSFVVPHESLEKLAKVAKIGLRPNTPSAVRVVSRLVDVLTKGNVED